jgi:hypothetical protein
MKILVCGGRDFEDYDCVKWWLERVKPISCIVSGGATGADTLAVRFAKETGTRVKVYPADWATHGRAAGPKRNTLMLVNNPDLSLVVAFPEGAGTMNMVKQAKKADISVLFVR